MFSWMSSPLILEYMLNEKLFYNLIFLTSDLIPFILWNHQKYDYSNILMIIEYLSNMKDSISFDEYKECVINVFYNILMNGTVMDILFYQTFNTLLLNSNMIGNILSKKENKEIK